MTANNTIYVFHLRKPDGRGIFLHPFAEFDRLIAKGGTFQIEGRYGDEPAIESITDFRNILYRIIEDSVNSWITESRFIPRFLISAGVFLFTYFFLSFVIRDPIPMVDEIAGGIAVAVFFYLYLGRKYKKAVNASKLRTHYRGIIDRIVFRESLFVIQLEALLHRLEGRKVEEMISEIINSPEYPGLLSEEASDERNQLLSYVERVMKNELSSSQRKIVSRIIMGGLENSAGSLKELDLVEITGEIDINLLVIYMSLREAKRQQPV